jgi:hypothetical protein
MTDDLPDSLLDDSRGELDAAGRAAFAARLAADPALAAGLARLYARLLRPLAEIAADPVEVPPGLVAATVARVVREGSPRPARHWWPLDRRAIEVAVALGLGFVAFTLVLGGVAKVRVRSQLLACQDRLRALGGALDGYSDAHAGRLPEIGTRGVPRAGDFAAELARAGQLDDATAASCPAGDAPSYAYTLGYHPTPFAPVTGVRRADALGEHDATPVAADLSAAHGGGQNVLFLGGNVRFATLATVGVRGDDIYRNDAGLVRAGLRRDDATLGGPTATP